MSIRHLFPICATAALLAVTSGVSAQVPYGGGMGGAGTGGMGGTGYRRGVDPTRKLPTANQLEGPPIPEFFVDRFELDSTQAGKYRALYDSFMDATAAIRDSARAVRSLIDGARQSGERLAARGAVPMLMNMGDSLSKAEDRFDNRLKTFLTSAQVKSYKKWKDDQRRQEHADDKPETASSDPNTQP